MVRSIGPIGKKAGLCARVPANRPAARVLERESPRPPGWRRPWVLQPAWRQPSRQPWLPQGRRRFSPRQGLPWWPPWICWCRLSLPGLLAIRAGPSRIRSQGRVASLPGFYRGAIVSTWADANGNVADTTQTSRQPPALGPPRRGQTRLCSSPCRKMSLGRSMPMKTILLVRGSPSAHWGPRSLPMSWCTPWKITLRSVPFMFRTPL